MNVRLNKAHFPVTALGPGRRIGLWFQGCTIGCPGCISRDTWDGSLGRSLKVADVVDWAVTAAPEGFDGVTISGGEPFQQPDALLALLEAFDELREIRREDFDLLAYSGYSLKLLRRDHTPILGRLDAIIPGPFIERRASTARWRGSANQEIVPLTERGRRRFADDGAARPKIQLCVADGEIFYVGVPGPGDMQKVEAAARARGVELGGASWHA